MRHLLILPLTIAASPALADGNNLGPDREVFQLGGIVPPLCKIGVAQNAEGQFDVGIMTDRTTGLLKRDIAVPTQRLQDSFCNSASKLSVHAVLMTPAGSTGTPQQGFSRGVHFTATVSGWTEAPASAGTGTAAPSGGNGNGNGNGKGNNGCGNGNGGPSNPSACSGVNISTTNGVGTSAATRFGPTGNGNAVTFAGVGSSNATAMAGSGTGARALFASDPSRLAAGDYTGLVTVTLTPGV